MQAILDIRSFRISLLSFIDKDNELHRRVLRQAPGSTYFCTSLGQYLEERQGSLE